MSLKNAPGRGTLPIVQLVAATIAADVHAYQGEFAVLNGGRLAPGSVATGLVCVGFFEKEYDNAGGAADAFEAQAVPGCRKVANSAGVDEITFADVGKDCFIAGPNTAAKTSGGGTRSRAGKVVYVDTDGVWVLASMNLGADAAPKIQRLTGTLVAGVLAISSGFELSASSCIIPQRINGAGTQGDELRVPSADRTVGAPGTAAINVRSFLNGAAATSDTSTIEVLIVG